MNPLQWSFRKVWLSGFVVCAALIAYALFAQYRQGLDPCPLCIFQRVVFMAMGLVFLVGGLHAPRSGFRYVYAVLVVVAAAVGIGIATRHLWIQSLPPGAVPSCGAPLGYLIDTRSAHGGLLGVLKMVLSGSGECAKVERVLWLPIPAWSLIWFALLGIWGALVAARRR